MQIRYLHIVVAVAVFIGACSGGPTKIESDLGIKGAPDWVNEGSQAISNKKGRFIHGMGSSQVLGNESLQRSTADNRARAELARVVSTYMNVSMRDFMQAQSASSQNTEQGSSSVSSEIEQEIASVSKVVINGSRIIGRWKDKRTGNLYSFAELDLKKLDEAIATANKLQQDYKEYYDNTSAATFDRFAEENY